MNVPSEVGSIHHSRFDRHTSRLNLFNDWDAEAVDKIYRVEGVDSLGRFLIKEYPIIKNTPCGCWIQPYSWGPKKFVNLQSKKAYAYPSKDKAIVAWYFRRWYYMRILQDKISYVSTDLDNFARFINEFKPGNTISTDYESPDW